MSDRLIGIHEIATLIRVIPAGWGPRPQIVVEIGDHRFDWLKLGVCSDYGLVGLPFGQTRDCRWSLADGASLHAHWFERRVQFHLDSVDPRIDPVGHVWQDTHLIEATGAGALLGSLGGVWWAAIGGLLGALLGHSLSGATSLWTIMGPARDGALRLQRVDNGATKLVTV